MIKVEVICDFCESVFVTYTIGGGKYREIDPPPNFMNNDICDGCRQAILTEPGVQRVIDERRKLNAG